MTTLDAGGIDVLVARTQAADDLVAKNTKTSGLTNRLDQMIKWCGEWRVC